MDMESHPIVALVSQLTQTLDDSGEVSVVALSGAELDMAIESQRMLISRLSAHLAVLVDQADALDRPAEVAAPSMVTWLRGRFGLSPRDAGRLTREVRGLRAAPVAAEAARLGAIPVEAAAEIGHAVDALRPEVGPELRAEGADVLLGFAVGRGSPALDSRDLAIVGRHLHEVLDPDGADLLLATRLEREDAEVWRRRFLSITDDHDGGGVRLRGLLTAEAAAALRAVLGPLAAPRPAAAPASPVDESSAGEMSVDPLVDDRSGGQRLVDGLHEACERLLAHGELPVSGGERQHLLVTVDYDRLAAGVGVGFLADGTELPAGTVRRLACDATVSIAILGTRGEVVYLGRSARTASPAQRRALALRDGGCAFPGCDRPAGWSDAHHIQQWEHLGRTDLDNMVLLCGYHHRTVHRENWEITPPKDGIRPLFIPPAWVDPGRRPRRNHTHHTRDLLRTAG